MTKKGIGISIVSIIFVALLIHHLAVWYLLRCEEKRMQESIIVEVDNVPAAGGLSVQAAQLNEYDVYEANYAKIVALIRKSSKDTEEMTNMIERVWFNSIWKKEDVSTNCYTKNDKGDFYPDYRDALKKYMNDEEINLKINDMNDNLLEIQSLMHSIQKEPEGYEKAQIVLKKAYEAYASYYECVLEVGCTYTEYVELIDRKDAEFNKKMDEVYLYVE